LSGETFLVVKSDFRKSAEEDALEKSGKLGLRGKERNN
jgi:hypothetical protein